jgi:8-oxo-dGTP diphosphatase
METIELITRGVLEHDGHILLVRQKGADYTFLPGGHINFRESAKSALIREIHEELGVSVRVGEFLGVIEHGWLNASDFHHELNLIFAIGSEKLSSDCIPISKESHLEFLWQPLNDLKSVNLKPIPLCELLPRWLKDGVKANWNSTLRDLGAQGS